MNFLIPQVYHIAETSAVVDGIDDWLQHIGAEDWLTDAREDSAYITELAGRRCYKSFGTELNPNITRVREGNRDYIKNIIASKHGSVLEHCYNTFAFEDVSRILTHELVRHRLLNISQESMRFVRPTKLSTIFPQVYTDHLTPQKAEQVKMIFNTVVEDLALVQKELELICGIENPNMAFSLKKLFQSANRRLIHDGMTTGIIITTNHRNARHIIENRTSLHAEEEIRYVIYKMFLILENRNSAIYQDRLIYPDAPAVYDLFVPAVTFEHSKI